MVPGSALRPARPQTRQDAALVRCRVTSHGLSLRLERGGGVAGGLLHFPAGNAAGWRHEAHRIIGVGPGASSGPLLLRGGLRRVPGLRGRERAWLFRGSDLKKSPAFGAFACWRWRTGAGDHVALPYLAAHARASAMAWRGSCWGRSARGARIASQFAAVH